MFSVSPDPFCSSTEPEPSSPLMVSLWVSCTVPLAVKVALASRPALLLIKLAPLSTLTVLVAKAPALDRVREPAVIWADPVKLLALVSNRLPAEVFTSSPLPEISPSKSPSSTLSGLPALASSPAPKKLPICSAPPRVSWALSAMVRLTASFKRSAAPRVVLPEATVKVSVALVPFKATSPLAVTVPAPRLALITEPLFRAKPSVASRVNWSLLMVPVLTRVEMVSSELRLTLPSLVKVAPAARPELLLLRVASLATLTVLVARLPTPDRVKVPVFT